jgi:endonuclease YncB( thermonuclease family)
MLYLYERSLEIKHVSVTLGGMRTLLLSNLLMLFISFPLLAKTQSWEVIDGDNIRQGDRVIRFWGMDAPERNQRCLKGDGAEYKCGQDAKTALEVLIQDKPLVCEYLKKDRYKRDVARCSVNGMDIGGLMVSLGWAIDYKRYSKGHYQAEQFQAQRQGLGLWNGEFEIPSEYRANRI